MLFENLPPCDGSQFVDYKSLVTNYGLDLRNMAAKNSWCKYMHGAHTYNERKLSEREEKELAQTGYNSCRDMSNFIWVVLAKFTAAKAKKKNHMKATCL